MIHHLLADVENFYCKLNLFTLKAPTGKYVAMLLTPRLPQTHRKHINKPEKLISLHLITGGSVSNLIVSSASTVK